jgi:hypothetical protein
MPTKKTKGKKAKAPSTQAGEYVREEMHQLEKGRGAPKSKKQAVAIGLSRARKAGVSVPKKKKSKETIH